MMRTSIVVLVLLFIALATALPTRSLTRQKRGFRINSSNRVAHGYGKRQLDSWQQQELASKPRSSELMTVQELVHLAQDNPVLLQALLDKFVDTDGDGIVTTQELFSVDEQE